MPVSLTDVARAAGVSIATVSRVLAGSDHPVSEATQQKVFEVAKELGYQPNLIARSLRTDQTCMVGIVVENILSPFIPPIIRGIQDELTQHQYFSIIINSGRDPVVEIEAIEELSKRQIDGIIFVESWLRGTDVIPQLTGRPHVFVHRLFNSLGANSVVPDDRYGACLAVRHLTELGHKRIAFVNGPAEWDATINRLVGYQEELQRNQLVFDERLVKQGDWQVQSGYRAALELLRDDRPSAFFAANDLMALGVIYAAQELGLHLPADIAVVGYDDRDFAGFVRPELTTVQMPCEAMGHISARLLMQIINEEIDSFQPVLVKGELVVRESCGTRQVG